MPVAQGLERLLIALLDATDKFAIVRVAGGVRKWIASHVSWLDTTRSRV
jgi:hypothetical protein